MEEGPAESYALYRFLGIVVGMLIAQAAATCVFQVRKGGAGGGGEGGGWARRGPGSKGLRERAEGGVLHERVRLRHGCGVAMRLCCWVSAGS